MPELENNPTEMALVFIESRYAGDVERNIKFARACMRDSLDRGEAPIAMHLLYTQEDILDDDIPEQRALGIAAGLAWGRQAHKTVVYTNLGITGGMKIGIQRAEEEGRPVEFRQLEGWE